MYVLSCWRLFSKIINLSEIYNYVKNNYFKIQNMNLKYFKKIRRIYHYSLNSFFSFQNSKSNKGLINSVFVKIFEVKKNKTKKMIIKFLLITSKVKKYATHLLSIYNNNILLDINVSYHTMSLSIFLQRWKTRRLWSFYKLSDR